MGRDIGRIQNARKIHKVLCVISDDDLIERARAGHAAAFNDLVRRYENQIFALAKKVCAQSPDEADGVSQETFLTAFQKLDQFRGAGGLGAWLYRIASNLCWMRLRKKSRHPTLPLPEAPAEALQESLSDPQLAARRQELHAAVTAALHTLSTEDRLVITLRDLHGLSAEATARKLRLSVSAVKSRLHRSRQSLRRHLEHFDA